MAFAIILGQNYNSYFSAITNVKLEKLEVRRQQLCLNFAAKCVNNPKHAHMFPKASCPLKLRNSKMFLEKRYRTVRSYKSAIPYKTRLLNEDIFKNLTKIK